MHIYASVAVALFIPACVGFLLMSVCAFVNARSANEWRAAAKWRQEHIQQLDALHDEALRIADDATKIARDSRDASALSALSDIGELIRTQDNRITSHPMFAVQQKRRIHGVDPDYSDGAVWVYVPDACPADSEETARLDALRQAGEPIHDDYRRVGYVDRWEFVTACFTEKAALDFITRNGHNLHEPRTYAYSAWRNPEWQRVRDALMSLPAPTKEKAA